MFIGRAGDYSPRRETSGPRFRVESDDGPSQAGGGDGHEDDGNRARRGVGDRSRSGDGETTSSFRRTACTTYAVRPPVLRVKPGDIVESPTLTRPGDYYEKEGGAWPGEVGPFYVEGAAPDDTLVVKILSVRLNRDTAVSFVRPAGLSALATDGRLRLLNEPLPTRRFVWQLDRTARRRLPRPAELEVEADRDSAEADGGPGGRGAGG